MVDVVAHAFRGAAEGGASRQILAAMLAAAMRTNVSQASECFPPGTDEAELQSRLDAVKPILAHDMAIADSQAKMTPPPRARRNVALHRFDVSMDTVGMQEANSLQRGARKQRTDSSPAHDKPPLPGDYRSLELRMDDVERTPRGLATERDELAALGKRFLEAEQVTNSRLDAARDGLIIATEQARYGDAATRTLLEGVFGVQKRIVQQVESIEEKLGVEREQWQCAVSRLEADLRDVDPSRAATEDKLLFALRMSRPVRPTNNAKVCSDPRVSQHPPATT